MFEVAVKDGQCTTREGSVATPDAVFVMAVHTLHFLWLEGLSARGAFAEGRVQITGDVRCLSNFVSVFGMHRVPGAA
ncbi:MAG: hypothetical protein NVSMB2_24540 [Chloroflexota bacterium]